jgi:hypothetical protein
LRAETAQQGGVSFAKVSRCASCRRFYQMKVTIKWRHTMQFSQLDTPSGHIVCGFILLIIGCGMYTLKIPIATEAMTSGLTVVAMAMKGLNGKTVIPTPSGPDTKTTVSTTSTSVTDPPKAA